MMTVFLLPPESEQLEYKREFNSSGEKKRLLRTVVAFANGKGGKIIIGVDDASRTVSGLPPETDLSRLTNAVTNSIADNCTPQVAYKIRVEILDEKIDIEDAPDSQDIEVKDGSIDFDNVDFSYSKSRDVLNLENIDLHIRSGETIGIIGGTGSAKSTLVQLIPRLYDVLDGEVKVGGINVKDYKLDKLRDSVAMVLQKNVLFSGTIRQNLLWGNKDATDEEIEHAAKAAQAHDFIMSFPDGYETELGQGGVNVSGGQKQRLCIARAIISSPKVLILDEPTLGLDVVARRELWKILGERAGSVTTVLTTHYLEEAEALADKIGILKRGRLVTEGSPEEIIAFSGEKTFEKAFIALAKDGEGDYDD